MKTKKKLFALLVSSFIVLTMLSSQWMMVAKAEENAEETAISYEDVKDSMGLGRLTVTGDSKVYSYPALNYQTGEIDTCHERGYMYKIEVPTGSMYDLDITYNGDITSTDVVGIVLYPFTTEEGEQCLDEWFIRVDTESNTSKITISNVAYLLIYDRDWSGSDIILSDMENITSIKDTAISITKTGTVEGVISDESYIYQIHEGEQFASRGFLMKTTLAPGQGYSLNSPSEYRSDIQFKLYAENDLGKTIIDDSDWAESFIVFNETTDTVTYYIWVSCYNPNVKFDKVPITVDNITFVSDMPSTAIKADGKPVVVKPGTNAINGVWQYTEDEKFRYELQPAEGNVYSVNVPANSVYRVCYEYKGTMISTAPTILSTLYIYDDKDICMNLVYVNNTTMEYYAGPYQETKIVNSSNTARTYYLVTQGEFSEGQIMVSVEPMPEIKVSYRTHIQSIGWEADAKDVSKWKSDGAMSGTSGKSKRLEGINIVVNTADKNEEVELGVQYTTHCQSYGWLPWSANGEMNGTEGEAKRLEAIKIQLTEFDAQYYDIYYRVHAQTYGWLGWAKNGEPAGTAGYGKRLEGIQIVVVTKGSTFDMNKDGIKSGRTEAFVAKEGTSPVLNGGYTSNTEPDVPGASRINVSYRTHVQKYGWQGWKYNGQMSGTSGEAKRLEGIEIKLSNADSYNEGDIIYTTHVQSYGWQGKLDDQSTWKKNGEMSGTSGEAKRLEAICINLTGDMAENYDIYYRVHAQSYGWLGWAKNGAPAGTAGYGKRLEGIQIVLVLKGEAAPDNYYQGVESTRTEEYISK